MLNNEPPEILGFFQDSYLRCDTRWGCYRLTNHFPDLLTRFPIIFYFKIRSNSDDSVFYFRDHSRSFYFLHHSPMFLATKFRGAARDIPSPPIVSGISLRALSLRDCMNKTSRAHIHPVYKLEKYEIDGRANQFFDTRFQNFPAFANILGSQNHPGIILARI